MSPVYRELTGRVLMVILSLFQYIEKLRSENTSFFYASWHAPVAKRTVYVVTTAAGQSFETMYEDTPLFLYIHRVNAITVLSAVPRLQQSLIARVSIADSSQSPMENVCASIAFVQ